jgi:uncharacterized membrane protein YgcG
VNRSLPLVLLVALGAGAPAAAQRSYAIARFDAAIQVERSSDIVVTETIVARFTGAWNGIFRTIPVAYRTAQGLNWTLGVHLLSAADGDGRPLRVEASRVRHYIKYKIWVPGAANATRTVVLRYRATNALRFFDQHDELYWNVTGDEWEVPLEAAAALVELPPGTEGVRAIAFNGAYGSTAQDARVEIRGTTVRIAMPHALQYREGLTAVVGWNKGVVAEPSTVAQAAGVATSNWPLVIPVPVFLLAFAVWRRRGRDPRRLPIAVQYEPPRGVTPAEAGTLLDNSADLRDITATLVDLAVRGYLRIEERDETKLFGLIGGRSYVLQRRDPPSDAAALAPHEQRVFDGVFAGRGAFVLLSQLEDEFYKELPPIRASIFDRLLGRGFYHARPDHVRTRWMVGGVVLGGLIAVGGGAIASGFLLTPVPFVLAGLLVASILVGFGLVMPARTEAGARALEHVLGFEEFLRRVESEHLKRIIVGHPELFDRYLPFAMAFGVERKWARAFEGIYTQAPTWYVGPSVTHFNVSSFSSSLADLSSRAGSTMTSSPRSSSGSGFGGGGSSGGGGGGGGGGAF